jgi:hypothetical protein
MNSTMPDELQRFSHEGVEAKKIPRTHTFVVLQILFFFLLLCCFLAIEFGRFTSACAHEKISHCTTLNLLVQDCDKIVIILLCAISQIGMANLGVVYQAKGFSCR